ncbi:glycoside hydrolase [Flammula alnicola]|nr:glycoside hydrolase [Flammula alnicola]
MPSGWTCTYSNPFYSQCLSASSSTVTSTSTVASTSTAASTTKTSTAPSGTLTGIAATAPTTPPSTLTGRLPALGWNSWNAYGGNINETKILAAANQFISLGLKDAGYQYVNIDDCWAQMARDATTGRMVPDPTKFPNGMSSLATQIHNLGLKIGIYSDAGMNTCAGFPGSLGNEAIDATTFNDWGIDYLKYDNCNVPSNWTDNSIPQGNDYYNSNSAIRYRQMTAVLAGISRPIQFELCIWGADNVWDWGARVGHSWRMSGDSSATWSYITSILTTNVAHLSSVNFFAHNDMDMMEIGNGALTIQEQRTHFAAWAFLKSPILLGTDMSLLSSTQLAIIKNPELLAFHQDSTIGVHVFIINTSSGSATKQFTFSIVPGLGTSGNLKVHDMWAGTDLSGTYTASSTFTVSVAAHDTVAYLITLA